MTYKKGQTLYEVSVDEDTGSCSMNKHIVTTIRGTRVYVVRYIPGITWVKKSTKHGDFGWADNLGCFRTKLTQGERSNQLHTTPRMGWQKVLKDYVQELVDKYDLSQAILDKIRKTAQRNVKMKKRAI